MVSWPWAGGLPPEENLDGSWTWVRLRLQAQGWLYVCTRCTNVTQHIHVF